MKKQENAYSKMWYQKNRESELETNREYRKQNRELFDWYHDKTRFGGMKSIVMKRDNYSCQMCGGVDGGSFKEQLTVHHIDGKNHYKGIPNNDLENLIVLCQGCHSFLHWEERRRTEQNRFKSREDIVRTCKRLQEP